MALVQALLAVSFQIIFYFLMGELEWCSPVGIIGTILHHNRLVARPSMASTCRILKTVWLIMQPDINTRTSVNDKDEYL